MRRTSSAVLPVVAMLAGCGSSSTGASPPPTAAPPTAAPPATAAPSSAAPTTSAAPSSAAPTTSAAPTSGGAVAACRDGQVKVFGVGGQGAGGTFLGGATLSLVGATPCTLFGYAGLDVVTGTGTLHAERGPIDKTPITGPARTITLRPGGTASVGFQWGESMQSVSQKCPTITNVVLTPPGLHTGTTARLTDPASVVCTQPLVGTVVPTP